MPVAPRSSSSVLLGARLRPAVAQTPSPAAGGGARPERRAQTAAVDPNEYRIGPEDVLQISIWKNEAMSRTVPVRPDGKISLPLLNDVQAAGLTPMEFRDSPDQEAGRVHAGPRGLGDRHRAPGASRSR